MTVNERLLAAGLLAAYNEAVATADDARVDTLLMKVGLQRGATGMHWSAEPRA